MCFPELLCTRGYACVCVRPRPKISFATPSGVWSEGVRMFACAERSGAGLGLIQKSSRATRWSMSSFELCDARNWVVWPCVGSKCYCVKPVKTKSASLYTYAQQRRGASIQAILHVVSTLPGLVPEHHSIRSSSSTSSPTTYRSTFQGR